MGSEVIFICDHGIVESYRKTEESSGSLGTPATAGPKGKHSVHYGGAQVLS